MWVVTLHNCGGSMAEAVDPQWSIGMVDEPNARAFCDALNNALQAGGHEDWLFAIYFEVLPAKRYNLPKATPAQLAQLGKLPSLNHVAVDMAKLVDLLAEGEGVEILPEPVSPEEEQAAIDSILKGIQP